MATNNKYSMIYTLPSNTTTNLKQRVGDVRTGMLAFANDRDNYGTLWIVDDSGKFIVPMSGTVTELLFEGIAKTTATFTLSNIITDYKWIAIAAGVDDGLHMQQTLLIKVSDIDYSQSSQYSIGYLEGTNNWGIQLSISNDNSFTINSVISNGWVDAAISKVYGIK